MDHTHHNNDSSTEYTCPMHPNVRQEKPGMCPICGMALVPDKRKKDTNAHERSAQDKHEGHHVSDFLKKFYITLALTIPILLYSDIWMAVFGWNAPGFSGVQYVILLLGSIIFFYGGWVFLIGAYRELRARLPGMMTLIAIAITAAYGFSVFATLVGRGETLFWELATLIAVMLIGHYVEMKAVQGAKGALKELSKLLPDMAIVMRDGIQTIVLVSEVKAGDTLLVKPGAKVPADGVIIEGVSEMNESIITGESKPVAKTIGEAVIAGSLNGNGSLTIKVTNVGEKTFLAGIMRLVADAEASKSRLQLLSDRAALYLTFIAVGAGLVTLVAWLFSGFGAFFAFERLVAVLVIACPHALGLAVPLVASISTTMGARNGVLIKKRLSLEAARTIDMVLFDKTGTLTKGNFVVSEVVAAASHDESNVVHLGASVNSGSEHSIAVAMVQYAKDTKVSLSAVERFERLPGIGAQGRIAEDIVTVGSDALLTQAAITPEYKKRIADLEMQGKTVVHVLKNQELIGSIAMADQIRPESRDAIAQLKAQGVRTAMITGDADDVAAWVAKELDLDEYFARVLPADKAQKVRALQDRGLKVAMVGDGVNDAPALAQADVGIAVGAGTNVAIESAGIILVKNDPRDIPKVIRLSKLTYRKMIQNLFWATGYNIVALPIAAGVLYTKGIMLDPAVAAVFMSLSTVIVSINAVLLRREKL